MKKQELNFTCGPSSIVNLLRCYGIKKTEKQILKVSNTDSIVGTTETDMIRVLKLFGCKVIRYETKKFTKAWNWLLRKLNAGVPVILCVNNWEHWVVAIGSLGSKVVIFDSNARSENNVLVYSKDQIKKLWPNKEQLCGGIAVKLG